MNGSSRASLLALAGGYVIYLAWEMIDAMRKGATNMAPWLSILCAILFVLAGGGVLYYAYRVWRQGKKDEAEGKEPPPKENENSLK